jgi:hypothetical protein
MPINYRDYHPKWQLIRRLILKRADNCCEECGIKNHTPIPAALQDPPTLLLFDDLQHVHVELPRRIAVLTIAHVDHDRTNNDFSNLAAWCQSCHLAHDLPQRVYSFKYGKETQYQNHKLF